MTWHILDVGSIWMREFAGALAPLVDTSVNWWPEMRRWGAWENWQKVETLADPPLSIRRFPLQRGYSRFPFSLVENLGRRQTARMLQVDGDAAHSPLICTTPYYAPVAERWPGPVVYYQTDLTLAYHGLAPAQVRSLDRRLCARAAAVCPNSQRIGHYFVADAGCDPGKIVVVPNATRAENVLAAPPAGPGPLPPDLADLPRPIVGVLGNLAANLDWELLLEAVEQTPAFRWAFIGPYSMDVPDEAQRAARERLLAHGGRVRFAGGKPYRELQGYARALDAALLPYRRKEPTFSGSSTRYYEHLAACRPILATRGFEELLHQEPLLRLADSGAEVAARLEELRALGFEDGQEQARWQASRRGTWSARAATLVQAVESRWPEPLGAASLPPVTSELVAAGALQGNYRAPFRLIG